MAKDKEKALADLRRFLGTEKDKFTVGEHEYTVLPLLAKDAVDLLDSQYPVLATIGPLLPEWRAKTDEYMKKTVRDKTGRPVGLDRALEDGWTVEDIAEWMKKMLRLSG